MGSRRSILKAGLSLPLLSIFNSAASEVAGSSGRKIVDHFMWAAVDLESASAEFEKLTGVRPVFGGSHPGFGTHNALVSLANGSYMEVLALDPQQSVDNPIVSEIKKLDSPAILAFHVQRANLDGVANVLDELNIGYTGPLELGRVRPDGMKLQWRLLFP